MFKQRESIGGVLLETPMNWCSFISVKSPHFGSRKCLLRGLYWGALNNNLLLPCVINLHQTSLVLWWLLFMRGFKPRLATWLTSGTNRHKKTAAIRGRIGYSFRLAI